MFMFLGNGTAACAQPDIAIEEKVRAAVHGPDGEGRDGPMAKLDRNLITLYYQYQASAADNQRRPFAPSDASLPVHDSLVTIDAIASDAPTMLLDSLTALGLQSGAQAGRLVSGQLPIPSLRAAARLSGLQSMRPAQARQKRRRGALAPPTDSASNEKTSKDVDEQQRNENAADNRSGTKRRWDAPRDSKAGPASAPDETASDAEHASAPQGPSTPDSMRQRDSAAFSSADTQAAPSAWMPYAIGGGILLLMGLLLALRRRDRGPRTN